MNAPYWLRRGLGASGAYRLRMLEALNDCLPDKEKATDPTLGFTLGSLREAIDGEWLASLEESIDSRGDPKRLLEIATWGSCLGDLACPLNCPEREQVMREAAWFNLGVALFDSFVDESDPRIDKLAEALSPSRLRNCLMGTSLTEQRDTQEDPSLVPIIRLFDAALGSAGNRFAHDKVHVDRMAALLSDMYESELGMAADPFPAKRLPVVFMAYLGSPVVEHKDMLAAVSSFVQQYDDWQDIAEDILASSPNVFLSSTRPDGLISRMKNTLSGIALFMGGPLGRGSIRNVLVASLTQSLCEARKLGPVFERKMSVFLHGLVAM